jgi:hypothetical protein
MTNLDTAAGRTETLNRVFGFGGRGGVGSFGKFGQFRTVSAAISATGSRLLMNRVIRKKEGL